MLVTIPTIERMSNRNEIVTSERISTMSHLHSPKTQWPLIRRRSLLAVFAGLATATSAARQGLGAEPSRGEGRGTMRRSEVTGVATVDLKTLGPDHQVRSISSISGAFRVTMASGKAASFSAFDLSFKVDSSSQGPNEGQPILMSAGMRADRALVVFASCREISSFVDRES